MEKITPIKNVKKKRKIQYQLNYLSDMQKHFKFEKLNKFVHYLIHNSVVIIFNCYMLLQCITARTNCLMKLTKLLNCMVFKYFKCTYIYMNGFINIYKSLFQ